MPKFRHGGSVLIRRLLYVAFFIEVGLMLMVLPWSALWEQNYFAAAWPALRPLFTNNFVRGGTTGLGIVNLVAGFAELYSVFLVRERDDAPIDGSEAAQDLSPASDATSGESYPSNSDARVEP